MMMIIIIIMVAEDESKSRAKSNISLIEREGSNAVEHARSREENTCEEKIIAKIE